jgi:hypothetical protein
MLQQLMQEIEAVGGTVSVRQLSQRLGVETSALEGMLDYLVRKGRLVEYSSWGCSELSAESDGQIPSCASVCPGARGCPFLAKQPKTYTLRKQTKDDQ